MLDLLLSRIDYDVAKRRFLYDGLLKGFHIHYQGPRVSRISDNHKSAKEHSSFVDAKLSKELRNGFITGPFSDPPCQPFIVSPIGLVPKKTPNEYRLIHDLSFPSEASVNSFIPRQYCSVQYETLDEVVHLVLSCGKGALIAKADIEAAFRILPIHPDDRWLLGIKWKDQYFVDNRLPMGLSESCSTFEEFSGALQAIIKHWFCLPHVSHILDDFIFVSSANSAKCTLALDIFLRMCRSLNVPINAAKTIYPATSVEVHGVLIDTIRMIAMLPQDKLIKARTEVSALRRKKRATLKQFQSMIGFLNFACRVVRPGRAFLRRLIEPTMKVAKSNHFIRISSETRLDLTAWLHFLEYYNGVSLLLELRWRSSETLRLHTDAAGSVGFGAVFGNQWSQGLFNDKERELHITVLELYPILLALALWYSDLKNSCVLFMCDNEAVVHIINSQTAKDKTVMKLVRPLVLLCMKHNILFRAKHVPGVDNVLADLISRQKLQEARSIAPHLCKEPLEVPVQWQLSELLQGHWC